MACEKSHQFDFLGSMIESVERVNRSFGARQAPYFFVSRARPHARVLLASREASARATRVLRHRRGPGTGGSA